MTGLAAVPQAASQGQVPSGIFRAGVAANGASESLSRPICSPQTGQASGWPCSVDCVAMVSLVSWEQKLQVKTA